MIFQSQTVFHYSLTCKPVRYENKEGSGDCYQIVIKRPIETPQTRMNTGFLRPFKLFPLDRSRRLRRDIIEHAVDMIDFIDDPVCHFV